uniref:ShKT domain-containing protein n=1 Tax=Leptobrachium leishanense TaxID=445787 RepID=A0A8C5MTZ5_9ANUR
MANVPFSQLTTNNATIRQIILDIHNELRRNVTPTACNMLKMEWSSEAEETARRYARMCKVGHSTQNERKTSAFSCGENLFLAPFKAAWEDVIRSFYSEVVDFRYGVGAVSPSLEIGHYTQLVWATTGKIGCAIAECQDKNFRYNYVCHYCPGGNYKNSIAYPYKSGPSCGDCPSACEKSMCTNPCPHQDKFGDCNIYYQGQKCDEKLESDCPSSCLCTNNEIK